MSDITIEYFSDYQLIPKPYKDIVDNGVKIFKGFNPTSIDYCGLVSSNNILIGYVTLRVSDNQLIIRVYQYPNVCRLSILSLIDSSIVFSQKLGRVFQTSKVVFKDVSYAHTFKLQQIISDIEIENDNYVTTSEKLLSVDMSKITLKNIILAKI